MTVDEKAIEAAEVELSRVLKDFDYCMPAGGMARVLKAAYEAAKPAPTDTECKTCVGTGLVEDPATSLSLGRGGFKICPDCAGKPAPSPAEVSEGVARRMLSAAKLLYANSEGCAVNHYADDHAIHGLPGWLADCAADIAAFEAALTASPAPAEKGEAVAWVQPGYLSMLQKYGSCSMRFEPIEALDYIVPLYASPVEPKAPAPAGVVEFTREEVAKALPKWVYSSACALFEGDSDRVRAYNGSIHAGYEDAPAFESPAAFYEWAKVECDRRNAVIAALATAPSAADPAPEVGEREACAALAEAQRDKMPATTKTGRAYREACEHVAWHIRARSARP